MVDISTVPPTISDLLWRVIEPDDGSFSEEFARFLVARRFPAKDQRRLKELGEKQRRGTLTGEEEAEMDCYIKVADLLELLKAKALTSLKEKPAQ